MLDKVFAALRAEGTSTSDLARELGIPSDELLSRSLVWFSHRWMGKGESRMVEHQSVARPYAQGNSGGIAGVVNFGLASRGRFNDGRGEPVQVYGLLGLLERSGMMPVYHTRRRS